MPEEDPVRYFSSFGWLGVEMFFAISGFIIPYSLYLRTYKIQNASDFFVRRAKRIEPPYILCIFIVVALNYAASFAPGFRGQPFVFDWRVFLAHFGYLNSVLELGWYNPVFWTLAIEFQFYVFVALVYPLISHFNWAVRTMSILTISLLGFVGNNNSSLLFHWLPLFSIGMIAFQYYSQHNTTQHNTGGPFKRQYCLLLMIVSLIAVLVNGVLETLAAVLTVSVIVGFGHKEIPRIFIPVAFLGVISYSLYLLHTPVGGKIVNLAARLPETPHIRYLAIIVAFGVSVAVSYIFWLLVERKSQNWSKRTNNPAA